MINGVSELCSNQVYKYKCIILIFELVTRGKDLLFSNREATIKQIEDSINKRKEKFNKGDKDVKSHPILVWAGTPGMGKSRLIDELQINLQDTKNITIVLGNGSYLRKNELEKDPGILIAGRLLYSACNEKDVDKFWAKIQKFEQFLNISDVLNIICQKISQKNIIIAVDEFQGLIIKKEGTGELNLEKIQPFLRTLGALQTTQVVLDKFLTVIVCGTLLEPTKTVLRVSNYTIEHIYLPLLSANNVDKIVTNALQVNLEDSKNVYRLLHSLNGWPRAVSEFILLIQGDRRLLSNFANLKISLETVLKTQYNIYDSVTTKYLDLISKIIITSISSTTITHSLEVPGHTMDWEEIAQQGLCYITSNNRVSFSNFLVMVFLNTSLGSNLLSPFLKQFYFILSKIVDTWQEWEDICVQYEAIRLYCLKVRDRKIKVSELYDGALLSSKFNDLELEINFINTEKCYYATCSHRWPAKFKDSTAPKDAESKKVIEFLDSNCIVKNAAGACCDWFSSRKSTDGRNCYFFCQGKLTATGNSFSLNDILVEYDKVKKIYKSI